MSTRRSLASLLNDFALGFVFVAACFHVHGQGAVVGPYPMTKERTARSLPAGEVVEVGEQPATERGSGGGVLVQAPPPDPGVGCGATTGGTGGRPSWRSALGTPGAAAATPAASRTAPSSLQADAGATRRSWRILAGSKKGPETCDTSGGYAYVDRSAHAASGDSRESTGNETGAGGAAAEEGAAAAPAVTQERGAAMVVPPHAGRCTRGASSTLDAEGPPRADEASRALSTIRKNLTVGPTSAASTNPLTVELRVGGLVVFGDGAPAGTAPFADLRTTTRLSTSARPWRLFTDTQLSAAPGSEFSVSTAATWQALDFAIGLSLPLKDTWNASGYVECGAQARVFRVDAIDPPAARRCGAGMLIDSTPEAHLVLLVVYDERLRGNAAAFVTNGDPALLPRAGAWGVLVGAAVDVRPSLGFVGSALVGRAAVTMKLAAVVKWAP